MKKSMLYCLMIFSVALIFMLASCASGAETQLHKEPTPTPTSSDSNKSSESNSTWVHYSEIAENGETYSKPNTEAIEEYLEKGNSFIVSVSQTGKSILENSSTVPTIEVEEEEVLYSLLSDEYIAYDLHRYALVIGNGKYEEGELANPTNDAKLIATKLSDAGFDVYRYENLTKSGMEDAVSRFVKLINKDMSGTAVFYYAGHGIEVDGINYLIPVDNSKIESEYDVKIYAYSLDNILSLLNAKEQIIILDACRNNPYRMTGDRAAGVKGGLGALRNVKKGVNMSYLFAAQSGQVAKDGDGGNSVFTMILAEEIGKPNIPISQLFSNVASRVNVMTSGEQVPLSSTTGSDFIFQSEDVSRKVLAKWTEQLREAQTDVKKYEAGSSGKDKKDNAELVALQAKAALAEAQKKAAEEREERLKKEIAAAAKEEEAKKNRREDLQQRIDSMRIAAENAATQAKLMQANQSSCLGFISDIESQKLELDKIVKEVDVALEAKFSEIVWDYINKADGITNQPYQIAELGTDGQPTEFSLRMREMKKEAVKSDLQKEYEEYQKQIVQEVSPSYEKIRKDIIDSLSVANRKQYSSSSLLGELTIQLSSYDGTLGGWHLNISSGVKNDASKDGRALFQCEVFLSYEMMTGKERPSDIKDYSDYHLYQEYLDNVDMFDSLFRSGVPIVDVTIEYQLLVQDGSRSYRLVPNLLSVTRTDNEWVSSSVTVGDLSTLFGEQVIESASAVDTNAGLSPTRYSLNKRPIRIKYLDVEFDVDVESLKQFVITGTKKSSVFNAEMVEIHELASIMKDGVCHINGYSKEYKVGDVGPAGGIIFYDCDSDNNSGKYSVNFDKLISSECGWRYLEAAPTKLKIISGAPSVDPNADRNYNGLYTFKFGYVFNNNKVFFVNGTNKYDKSNCTRKEIGQGENNTQLLVKAMGDNTFIERRYGNGEETWSGNYAARLCDILVYEYNNMVFDDWFLPSLEEHKLLISKLSLTNSIWSSSELEQDQSFAYVQPTGVWDIKRRDTALNVYPIRAF